MIGGEWKRAGGIDKVPGVRFIAEVFNEWSSAWRGSLALSSASWTPAVGSVLSAGGTQPRAANQFTTENVSPASFFDRLQCAALDILVGLHVGLPESSVSLRKRVSLFWIDHGRSGNALDTGAFEFFGSII